jgi:hypothetical protein
MRNDSNTNLLLIGHLEGLKHAAIAYAIQRAQVIERLTDACASIGTAARGTTEKIVVFSNILRDSEVFKDNELIIKNSKSQTSNWNRRNKYKPIYRRSIIS